MDAPDLKLVITTMRALDTYTYPSRRDRLRECNLPVSCNRGDDVHSRRGCISPRRGHDRELSEHAHERVVACAVGARTADLTCEHVIARPKHECRVGRARRK